INFYTLVLSTNRKPLTKVATYGYISTVQWSPDGSYVAVNNRRGNSGDYIWVFHLPDGEVLKRPGDNYGESWQKSADAAFEKAFPVAANGDNFIRNWVTAAGWKGGRLLFVVRSIYRGEDAGFDFEGSADVEGWRIVSSKVSKVK